MEVFPRYAEAVATCSSRVLRDVSRLPGVRFVGKPHPFTTSGSASSRKRVQPSDIGREGIIAHAFDVAHAAGAMLGNGIKIGVISDGVDGLSVRGNLVSLNRV